MVSVQQKRLGVWTPRWTGIGNKFVVRQRTPDVYDKDGKVVKRGTELGIIQIGKERYYVTKNMGEYMKKAYRQGVKGLKTRKEVQEFNKRFTEDVARGFGKTGVLFENIMKESGMESVFKQRLKGKLSPHDTAIFDDLAKMIKDINKDRIKAEQFYSELTEEFKIVGTKYERMQSNHGILSEEDVAQLTNALERIHSLAEVYAGRISRADYYAIHGEF